MREAVELARPGLAGRPVNRVAAHLSPSDPAPAPGVAGADTDGLELAAPVPLPAPSANGRKPRGARKRRS